MKDWSRRALFRASAGAAVAVPMAAIGSTAASAAPTPDAAPDAAPALAGTVMFCIHDAARSEVSILHGTSEVVVRDRTLVTRILAAAASSQSAIAAEKA